jgi:hypothetical protein
MYHIIHSLPADIQAMSTTAWIYLMINQFLGSKVPSMDCPFGLQARICFYE